MKKVVLFSMIVLLAFTVKAQTRFGVKAGFNLAKMSVTQTGLKYNLATQTGLNFGVITESKLSDFLYIQSGLSYSGKGVQLSVLDINADIKPQYLEVPVNVVFKLLENSNNTRLMVFAGPNLAYGIAGKYTVDGDSENIKFGSDSDKDMKAFDFGLNFGTIVSVTKNIELIGQYGLGLSNLSNTKGETMKNGGFSFSVAYLFGGKK